MKYKNQKGLGLVEVVAALGISVVVITALVSLTVYTLRSSQRSKALLEASKQANQTLELVRALRDSSDVWIADDVGDPPGFIDAFAAANCSATSACKIDANLTVSSYTPPAVADLGPTDIDVYFYTYTPTECSPPEEPETCNFLTTDSVPDADGIRSSDTVRISVFSNTRMGDQLNTTTVYTDLTNWRQE